MRSLDTWGFTTTLLASAAICVAMPAFAQTQDSDSQQAMEKGEARSRDHLPPGTKRMWREMAKSEGDPQGLIAVPHSAMVEAEYARLHAHEEPADATAHEHHRHEKES